MAIDLQDRLVEDSERAWTNENIDSVALKHFPNINRDEALQRPILFSNWLSKNYIPVDREVTQFTPLFRDLPFESTL